jgi:DNA-directed RNA polymerase subunit RPC12/RpoP
MTQQTTTTNYKCTECGEEVSFFSRQALHAESSALTAKIHGGMPFEPENFVMCEDCEGNQETPYDF